MTWKTPYQGVPADDSVEVEKTNIKSLAIAVIAVLVAVCVIFAI